MKYVMIVGDGMADLPVKELNNKTPLEVADIPNMDYIALHGSSGLAFTFPEGLPYGSDVANMSLLGYNPAKYYTGRGPIEAFGAGIKLKRGDIAFRCNFITVKDGVIIDYSAGHIPTQEAKVLIECLNKCLGDFGRFYAGVSYRNIFITEIGGDSSTIPPHEILNEKINENLITNGKDSELLNEIMLKSKEILENHPINIKRKKNGLNPANMIWLWGNGTIPEMESFYKKFGLKGCVICAVSLIKGLGTILKMDVPEVPGATGYIDTNYKKKAETALKKIDTLDFAFIHIEAPDEMGHERDVERKIKAIEMIDKEVVGTLLDNLSDDYRLVITTDHMTPVNTGKHEGGAVPFSIFGDGIKKDDISVFSERSAKRGYFKIVEGYKIMKILRRGSV